MAKKSNKVQGKKAQTGEMSDHRVQMSPDKSKGRGMGTEFAYAVQGMLAQAADLKGSQSNFLGAPKESIDVKEFVQSLAGK